LVDRTEGEGRRIEAREAPVPAREMPFLTMPWTLKFPSATRLIPKINAERRKRPPRLRLRTQAKWRPRDALPCSL
jgi:hypothetical protein